MGALIELVLAQPIASAGMIARELGVSPRAAQNLVAELGLREAPARRLWVDPVEPRNDATGSGPNSGEGRVAVRPAGRRVTRNVMVAWSGYDALRTDANRTKMVQQQLEEELVPAGPASILRVAGKENAVEAPTFGQAAKEYIQHLLARVVLDPRNCHLVVAARKRSY